jgi:hypothetical protein
MVDSSFEASLRARIEGHNSFFNELIKVIPAKYYIPAKDDGQQNNSWVCVAADEFELVHYC